MWSRPLTPSNAATDDLAASPEAADREVASGKDNAPAPIDFGHQRELVKRVIMALILAPAGIYVVLEGGLWLAVATAVCAFIAAMEWARMSLRDATLFQRGLIGGGMAAGAVASVQAGYMHSIELVALVSLLAVVIAGLSALMTRQKILSSVFGAFYVSFPFGAFMLLREHVSEGPTLLMSLMMFVWVTDIAAFLAGRGFGGPALSPKQSPNKTWTGAVGALLCTTLAGAVVARILDGNAVFWMLVAFSVSMIAQAGDLLESWCKRIFDVKDSSGIIPGHGGVLDRLDSLMAVSAVAAVVAVWMPSLLTSI